MGDEMSARRAQQDLKAGVERLEHMWDDLVDKHIGKGTPRPMIAVALGSVPHVAILFFTAFVVWTAKPSSGLFSWHPTLMSIAFVLLMSEAILLFSPWSSPAHNSPRASKVQWHWVAHGCALLCAYTGLAVITASKVLRDKPHYTTWHGAVGITVCGMIAVQASGGIAAMWPNILPFKLRLVTLKRLHAVCGMCSYLGALSALVLSLYSNWFAANVQNMYLWLACLGCLPVLGLAVLAQVVRNHLSALWSH